MNNTKSIVVTCIFSLMFMTLTFCFYRIAEPAFIIIVSILSAYGFVRTIFDFNRWISSDNNSSIKREEKNNVEENEDREENLEIGDIIEQVKNDEI
jgi:hypothetical protein